MKIRIASDLHIEFLGDYGSDWNSNDVLPIMENEKEQVLVLSGDILMLVYKELFRDFFTDLSNRFKFIVVICGNHEFYRYEFDGTYREYELYLSAWSNIQLLQNTWIDMDDVAIFGATLWTDFRDRNPIFMNHAKAGMSDYKVINYKGRIWTPDDSVDEHELSVAHLQRFFDNYAYQNPVQDNNWLYKKVVISHHLPSEICNDPRFKGSNLNPAFSSNLDDLILHNSPDLWIFGHTHHSSDQLLGRTRLISNPRGYYNGRENPHYNGQLVIQL